MDKKKMAVVLFLFLIISSLNGCYNKGQSGSVGSQESEPDKLLRQVGFNDAAIEQIQVTTDDKVLVSSDGKLYLKSQGEFLDLKIPEPVSIFYVLERENSQTLLAGTNSGSLYLKEIQEDSWRKANLRAYSQPLNTIAGDIANGYIYVGQASKLGGGLWLSRDSGETWDKLTNTTTRGIVVHPEKSDVLYAVDRVTLLSTNGGRSWEKINAAANYGVLIHPGTQEIAYIVFAQGVVVAEHNGNVKETRRFGLQGTLTCLELNFAREGEWAAGIWDYPSGTGGLYLSFDSGTRWISVKDLINVRVTDLRFNKEGNKLYVGTAGNGLLVLNLDKISS